MTFVRDHFVPVIVDAYIMGTEVEKRYYGKLLESKDDGYIGTNLLFVAAPSGKFVGYTDNLHELRDVLGQYRRLPESDRKPSLEKYPGGQNPAETPPAPPPGGLTLIVYNTPLERNGEGKLIRAPNQHSIDSWPLEKPMTFNELLWLTREEWRALIPPHPERGREVRVPEPARRRLFQLLGYDWNSANAGLAAFPLREGDLAGHVEEVTPRELRIRLQGYSKVGLPPQGLNSCAHEDYWGCEHLSGELNFRGTLRYDRARQSVLELSIVAFGETATKFDRRTRKSGNPVKRYPTGLVIELASDCPANRTWPVGAEARMKDFGLDYWNMR